MRQRVLVLGVTAFVVIVIFMSFYSNVHDYVTLYNGSSLDKAPDKHVQELKDVIDMLIEQRNRVSRQLNLKQQKIGQLECEKSDNSNTKANKLRVSESGGWCATVSGENSREHKTDTKLVPALADFFSGKLVASFGDGPGVYKQMLTETGKLKAYDAYDGAPYSEKTSEGRVDFLDLTLPQYGIPVYDWIISLEVAEHIPAKFESVYIDNIVRHAKEGVILSWAKPGQSGYSHVNNKPFDYVKKLFSNLGFEHDANASDLLKGSASVMWLKENTNVYRRRNMSVVDSLEAFS